MRFRYLQDPLFLISAGIYVVNRFLIKPHTSNQFCHQHLNDLLCIPFCVPIMLLLERSLCLRRHDRAPEGIEVLVALLVWAIVFELILPEINRFKNYATGDAIDILYYIIGACVAMVVW